MNNKLASVTSSSGATDEYALQRTLLCTWLLEMYLHRLNMLLPSAMAGEAAVLALHDDLEAALRDFVSDHYRSFDKATTLALFSMHGRTEELLQYCTLIGDFDRVLSHYLQRNDYTAGACFFRVCPHTRALAPHSSWRVLTTQPYPYAAPLLLSCAGAIFTLCAALRTLQGIPITLTHWAELWYRYSPLLWSTCHVSSWKRGRK
ncbi:hypothetical protein EON66_07645 [archaeon]|nr:MAG: hypothetical protein EON66_07645 [archaeon]